MKAPEFGAGWFTVAVEEHGVLAGENCDGGFFEKDAAPLSQSGPIPNRLWWKLGMMCAAVVGSWERRTSQAEDD